MPTYYLLFHGETCSFEATDRERALREGALMVKPKGSGIEDIIFFHIKDEEGNVIFSGERRHQFCSLAPAVVGTDWEGNKTSWDV